MKRGIIRADRGYLRKEAVDDRVFSAFVEHAGNVIYNGIYQPEHPLANADGFREDVIQLVKELHLAGIRYPGGNFVCSYRWEDTVGPVEERPVRADLAWRQREPNIVGLAEFEKWVKAVKSELIMAVNLSTRGAVDAANLVEYCNHPGGTYYSELRKTHGHEVPYGVHVWCVGNEVDGPWNIGQKRAEEYGWDAAEAAKAMRRIDPKIELVAVGSSGTQLDTYLEWDRVVLERVYDSCDYISLHRYMGMPSIDELSTYDRRDTGDYLELASRLERNIQDVIAACDYVKGRKHSDKTMYISLDEYNAVDIGPEADDFLKECDPWEVGPCTRRTGISMRTTLLFGLGMLAILRHTDRIRIACQSILINGDGMVMCSLDEDAWVNGSWHIFRLCSLYGRGKVLETVQESDRYDTATCKDVAALDSVCIYHEDTKELDIFAVNKTEEDMEFTVQAAGFQQLQALEHLTVTAEHLSDRNSAKEKNKITTVSTQDITCGAGQIQCILKPYSWNVLRVKERIE